MATPNLFDLLHQSHEIQRSLCRALTTTKDEAKRLSVFLQLKAELAAHAAAEERYLYVPLLMTDGGLSASRHALSEHHDIDELCEDLSVTDKSGAGWMSTAKELAEKVRHHLKEEERKFFKVAGRLLDDRKKATLARQYERDLLRMRRRIADEYQTIAVGPGGQVAPAKRNRVSAPPSAAPARQLAQRATKAAGKAAKKTAGKTATKVARKATRKTTGQAAGTTARKAAATA